LQRGTRGYSKKEYWNLNSWVGKVILNNLKHFKEEKRMGYPATFKDCYEWEKKLDKMIAGWEVLVEWDEIFECIDKRYQRESKGKTKKFYGLKIKELTKEERKAFNEETEKLYNKAVKNAKLLPEFFMSLWD